MDFHAIRHTVTTLLANSGANLAWIDELTGHASPGRSGETDRYIKQIDLRNLKTTIDRLDLDVDFSELFIVDADTGRTPR